MREIDLNGYIDEAEWYGDEITPENLHDSLYGANNENADDVHIRLNSYGGSCNAAVRMYDDIRAYPGAVLITVSGTAASAATMLCMAADRLEMTPGSLFMIHDPSMMAFGNEQDLTGCIELLRACKESILNMYERRVRISRNDTAAMMTATTWMDARTACDNGFVDSIVDDPVKYPVNNAGGHEASVKDAMEKVNAWLERKKKDGQGQYIWQPGLREGAPDVLFNQRLITSNYMPLVGAGNKVILYGDYSYYWLAERQGRSLERLNELFAVTDQVGFKMTERLDGRLILPEAVKVLQMKA